MKTAKRICGRFPVSAITRNRFTVSSFPTISDNYKMTIEIF